MVLKLIKIGAVPGSAAPSLPETLQSRRCVYSMTKPLVSVATMTLVEDGKIELTEPVSKFFPAFKTQQVSVSRVDYGNPRFYWAGTCSSLPFRFRRGMPNTSAYATGKHILSISGTGDRDRWGMTAMTLPD